jgi:hypothetical protein
MSWESNNHEFTTPLVSEIPLVPETTAALPKGTKRLLGALGMLSIMLESPCDDCIIKFAKGLVE